MTKPPIAGTRVPQDWQQQIQEMAKLSRPKQAEVLLRALLQYCEQVDPRRGKGAQAGLEDRVVTLGRRLLGLGRLVG